VIDRADLPEYLRGPLKFYWVDTGGACGLVVISARVGAIVDCAPIWQWAYLGRTLRELCDWNPDASVRRLKEYEGWRRHREMEREKEWTRRRHRGRVSGRR